MWTLMGRVCLVTQLPRFFFSSRRRHTRWTGDWSSDVCSSDLNVRIPAGVRDGAKVRLAGKGTPGQRGGPAGDLFVNVHVSGHEVFGRSGDDLTLTVPITFAEAALGTTLRVPTLDGAVSLKVAPGTPSGRTLRVRGRGIKSRHGHGDLLVTVEVAVPAKLDGDAREALEKFAATQTADPRPHITAALGTESPRGGGTSGEA